MGVYLEYEAFGVRVMLDFAVSVPGLFLAFRRRMWWDSEPIAVTVCFVTTPCEKCIP